MIDFMTKYKLLESKRCAVECQQSGEGLRKLESALSNDEDFALLSTIMIGANVTTGAYKNQKDQRFQKPLQLYEVTFQSMFPYSRDILFMSLTEAAMDMGLVDYNFVEKQSPVLASLISQFRYEKNQINEGCIKFDFHETISLHQLSVLAQLENVSKTLVTKGCVDQKRISLLREISDFLGQTPKDYQNKGLQDACQNRIAMINGLRKSYPNSNGPFFRLNMN